MTIDKLASDLASIERYAAELEEVDEETQTLRSHYGLNEHDDEYNDSIRTCMADDVDNLVDMLTKLSSVLEDTELMTKEEFEAIDQVLIAFMARLESMK